MKPVIEILNDPKLNEKKYILRIPDCYIVKTKRPRFKILYWIIKLAFYQYFKR